MLYCIVLFYFRKFIFEERHKKTALQTGFWLFSKKKGDEFSSSPARKTILLKHVQP
jgi:hypothetical protein